jgi:monovalent cation:proton antiporter-2 (CPA2) family protein
MSTETFFGQAFVYLTAAVVAVPLAKRFGLGSVLGYLLAGVVIGPFGLGLVGEEGQDVMHFAEFGVVMMLFVIGLELAPALLWRLRKPILGLGGLQVGITTVLVMGIGLALGLEWQAALAVGMTLALSSTAIVLQTLAEKGLLKSAGGQSAFSVLLFQDIAVIPMLAILPLLATGHAESAEAHATASTWIEGLPGWIQTLAVLGAVTGIVVGGRYLLRPVFRILGRVRMREIFTAAALLLVIGIALLMTRVGLSPALGTFLAGVVLANSEYRHELESDIEPFKGLLLGLFFIAVGASIDFALIRAQPWIIVGITVGMVTLKFGVLAVLARVFRLGMDQGLLFAFALPQMGEFAFVLFSFANQEGVLTSSITSPLVAAVALSMALTPLLLMFNERVLRPHIGTKREAEREPDEMEEHNPGPRHRLRPGRSAAPPGPQGLLRGRHPARPPGVRRRRPGAAARAGPGQCRTHAGAGQDGPKALSPPHHSGSCFRLARRPRPPGSRCRSCLPPGTGHGAPHGRRHAEPPGLPGVPSAPRDPDVPTAR